MKSGKLHVTKVWNVTILPVPEKSKLIMERLKKTGWRGNYLFEGGLLWKNDLILSQKLIKKKPNVQA
jgi:hypothetical protein